LVRFSRLLDQRFEVYGKLEGLNPGGSLKDRPASAIISAAVQSGRLTPGRSVVIESSSGNFAVGLAQACRYFDLALICVVDPRTPSRTIDLLRAFGARVEIVSGDEAGGYLEARLRRVEQLRCDLPDGFWPDQYGNPLNPGAHHGTVREIIADLDGPPDYLFCATGTCGTLRGCVEVLRGGGHPTRVVAVDAIGSVIFGHPPGRRLIPGHGASVRPALSDPELADRVVHVGDAECVAGCRLLLEREAYLGGGSCGGLVAALLRVAPEIESGARVVLILPDRGERYLDTVYDDRWVDEQLGALPALR
jgi:cysteine synthase A